MLMRRSACRRQRLTAATMRPPRTWRATMAASPALLPAGHLPTPLSLGQPGSRVLSRERRGGGNRFTGFRNLGFYSFTVHTP